MRLRFLGDVIHLTTSCGCMWVAYQGDLAMYLQQHLYRDEGARGDHTVVHKKHQINVIGQYLCCDDRL